LSWRAACPQSCGQSSPKWRRSAPGPAIPLPDKIN
jgi:hypothetical protein